MGAQVRNVVSVTPSKQYALLDRFDELIEQWPTASRIQRVRIWVELRIVTNDLTESLNATIKALK
jgi:hypothetical protein